MIDESVCNVNIFPNPLFSVLSISTLAAAMVRWYKYVNTIKNFKIAWVLSTRWIRLLILKPNDYIMEVFTILEPLLLCHLERSREISSDTV
jgi:hypothetical protein